ncbi:MAG: ribonuclease P protein component [Anaerolineae bacterium]
MLPRQCRLVHAKDFRRVYSQGRSVANALLVLRYHPNQLDHSRFGFAVGRRVGKAIVRNRVRRRMREAVRAVLDLTHGGWDVVLIARSECAQVGYDAIASATIRLFHRAGLFAGAGTSEDVADGVSSTADHTGPSSVL